MAMTVRRIVIIFDKKGGKEGPPKWWCQHPHCHHGTEFLTVALFHQHDAHRIPMQELVQRTAHVTHKTEVASDAG